VPVELDVASEFRYREAPLRKGDLAILISQSGETADTLADIIDTRRSLRLEIIIVILIGFEIVIGVSQILIARGGH